MKEIRDDSEKTEAAGENYKFVICSKFLEESLLIFLERMSLIKVEEKLQHTSGNESFTGCCWSSLPGGIWGTHCPANKRSSRDAQKSCKTEELSTQT